MATSNFSQSSIPVTSDESTNPTVTPDPPVSAESPEVVTDKKVVVEATSPSEPEIVVSEPEVISFLGNEEVPEVDKSKPEIEEELKVIEESNGSLDNVNNEEASGNVDAVDNIDADATATVEIGETVSLHVSTALPDGDANGVGDTDSPGQIETSTDATTRFTSDSYTGVVEAKEEGIVDDPKVNEVIVIDTKETNGDIKGLEEPVVTIPTSVPILTAALDVSNISSEALLDKGQKDPIVQYPQNTLVLPSPPPEQVHCRETDSVGELSASIDRSSNRIRVGICAMDKKARSKPMVRSLC